MAYFAGYSSKSSGAPEKCTQVKLIAELCLNVFDESFDGMNTAIINKDDSEKFRFRKGSILNNVINKIDITLPFLETIRNAGKAIVKIQKYAFIVERKEDLGPVTAADRISHDIITAFLKSTYCLPILSEEDKFSFYQERKNWKAFWLVDALDGTKEFISGNEEFSVNVALIQENEPVMGAIYLPAKDLLYYAVKGKGSYKIVNDETLPLPFVRKRQGLTVVGSRSHRSVEFNEYIKKLQMSHDTVDIVSAGSSFKFCLIAEGVADLYPRLGPTMEWDTAAGQIIAEEAGGCVLEAGSNRRLTYNKADLRNPHFIVTGRSYHDCE